MAQPATINVHASQARERMPITLAGRYNRAMHVGSVIAIGWRAAETIADAAAEVRVFAPLGASIYIAAGAEILWLGGPSAVMHPRAILLATPPDLSVYARNATLTLPPRRPTPWRPDTPTGGATAALALRDGARRLAARAASIGEPEGFGPWLLKAPLRFPLTSATNAAEALARACARNDAPAAAQAAVSLLGLGPGLTPSGDDFVGGAFFARVALAQLGAVDASAWSRAAATVRAAAREATTPISATLLGDLLDGAGWSTLHELVCALVVNDTARAFSAAARLTRLGHSSGWDLLAGFIAGAT
jgi:hypothetical protein